MGRCREICRKIKKKIVVEKKIPVEFPVMQGRLLVGKVAMIVGGAGGIGYAIAPGSIATPMLGIKEISFIVRHDQQGAMPCLRKLLHLRFLW